MKTFLLIALSTVLSVQFVIAQDTTKPGKSFLSPLITEDAPDQRISIEVDIRNAKHLVLEVSDGGDGSRYDWADWIEPRLVGPRGELKLTELEWKRLNGRAWVNQHEKEKELRVGGESIAFGLGTRAPSRIVYDLPAGYELFKAEGALDDGGTGQEGRSSAQFHVHTNPSDRVSHIATGFRVEALYDAEMDKVGSWVALTVDGKGRLITSDRQGPLYRMVVPEIGQDGEVEVEELAVEVGRANGLLEAFGSLYVVGKGSGRYEGKSGLFRLKDTIGDDQYDSVEFLVPLKVGSDHHAHNVLVHPDGKRLVILSGNNTDVPAEVATRHIRNQQEDHLLPRGTYYGHNTNRMSPGGFVIICEPDGSRRRVHCAGFRNPYDFAYNRDGELFTFDADMEYDVGGPWYRPTRVNHTVSGADFGWRWGAGKWPEYYPDSVGSVVDIGRGSPTGIVFGYGAKFPARYQEALFIADWTYGRMFAVHMTPKGATYTGTAELFVQGLGMPISEVVIRPQDGAMYYVTGGRRQKTTLFRVTYVGEEPTEPVVHAPSTGLEAELRKVRRALEAFHGEDNPVAVDAAWPQLAHRDRFIRFAARTAVEHQPLGTWRERALAESRPVATIEVAVALARVAEADLGSRLLAKLNKLDFSKLALEQKIDLLRAYGLVFIRVVEPDPATTAHLVSMLNPLYPSGITSLDRELTQMLLYLGAPGAVTKTVKLLLDSEKQTDEMFYAYHLRTIEDGWTCKDREAFFGWLGRTEASRADYVGGGHFKNFLKLVRGETTERLSEADKTAIAAVLSQQESTAPPRPKIARKFVREWTLDGLRPSLNQVDAGRAFIRGKRISEALCSSCHLFKGQGGALGPDLTSVGSKLNAEALLIEILEPSRVISEQHASHVLVLNNGTTLVGREMGGDDTTIRIAVNPQNPEEIKTVQKSAIVARQPSPISMMPKDILNVLKEEEILDLLMYLLAGGRADHIAFDR
jgi:putative heme-binding domain-containing protein